MYLRILKKDLRSRPVTNLVLFLFILLSVMFAAAGVSNVITVLTAQEDYYDRAGMADCTAAFTHRPGDTTVEDLLTGSEVVSSFTADFGVVVSKTAFQTEGAEDADFFNNIMVTPLSSSAMTYFDADNRAITEVQPGELYVPKKLVDKGLFRVGETFRFRFGETELTLTTAGTAKDALCGSESIGLARVFVSEADYERIAADPLAEENGLALYGIQAEDTAAVDSLLAGFNTELMFSLTRVDMGLINYLDMVIAAMLILLSACLVLVFLTVLRYTVRFTLSQELREIGIMKAVGLRDRAIERLYLIKYLFMAVFGAVLGFAASVPFGVLLLQPLCATIVVEARTAWSVNLGCSLLVLVLVLFFCRRCLKRQRRITPVDAVRSGSEAESGRGCGRRFSLAGSRLRPRLFLPVRQVLGGLRQYLILGLTCTICLLLILVVADTMNTMNSSGIYATFGLQPSDAIWTLSELPESWKEAYTAQAESNSQYDRWEWLLSSFEQTLEELDISADAFIDTSSAISLSRGDKHTVTQVWYGIGIGADAYSYLSGTAPLGEHEIALTPAVAESLGVEIGDTVRVSIGSTEEEFLVTALFSCMMNLGHSTRVGTDTLLRQSDAMGNMGIQVKFEEGLSQREKNALYEKLKAALPGKFYTATEFLYTLIGDISSVLKTVRNILSPLMLAVCVFVTVLMESSFIDKEKGEIALMKALGFRGRFIRGLHLRRTALTVLISILPAELLALPVAQGTTGIAFRRMGATRAEFFVRPWEIYLFWPALLLLAALLAVGLTAYTTNRIQARDTANIE